MAMKMTKDGKIVKSSGAGKSKGAGKGSKVSDSNLMAAIAYLGLLVFPLAPLLTLLIVKDDRFVKFHSIQSLLIIGVGFVGGTILGIISIPITLITFGFGFFLIFPIALILMIGMMAAIVYCGYKAYEGEMYKLPYLGDFAERHLD